MTQLAEVKTSSSGDSPYKNFIVIPGLAGRSLSDRTCPHFDEWLGRIVVKCATSARSWVYNHCIRLEELESWDTYCTTGRALLQQLLYLQGSLNEALIEAWSNVHKDDHKQLLEMVEMIMFVGEPSLHPKKPDEWIDQISHCAARQRGLPKRLASGATVGTLQNISDAFEDILLHSTLFDVTPTAKSLPTRRFRLKRMEHDGCIFQATIHVRLFTTSSEETIWDPGLGDPEVCPFHPKSSHFEKLLTLDSYSDQLLQVEPNMDNLNNSVLKVKAQLLTNTPVSHEGTVVEAQTTDRELNEVLIHKLHKSSYNKAAYPNCQQSSNLSSDKDTEDMQRCYEIRPIRDNTENESERDTDHGSISRLVNPSSTDSSVQSRERKAYFSSWIPSCDHRFYGRNNILRQLEHTILGTRNGKDDQHLMQSKTINRVWLTGAPGIGKTSVALKFAYQSAKHFKFIIWLNAASNANLGKHCHDAAVALGIVNGRICQDHQASWLRLVEFLKSSSDRWLLILDDCVEWVNILPYLPNDRRCSVIATGRRSPTSSAWTVIDIPLFKPQEAAHVLLSYIENKVSKQEARSFRAAAIQYPMSPLYIRLLGERSIRGSITLKDIDTILNLDIVPLVSIGTPVQEIISFTIKELDTPASSVLATLCFYDSTRIFKRLLRTAQARRSKRLNQYTTDPDEALYNAIPLLCRSALLDIDDSETESFYYMQKSVQDLVRTYVNDETWRDGFETACESINYLWPSKIKLKNIIGGFWEDFDSLHTHVQHLAKCFTTDRLVNHLFYDPGDEFKRLLVYHTWYNSRRGNYEEDQDLRSLTEFLLTATPDYNRNSIRRVESPAALPRRCILVEGDSRKPTARLIHTEASNEPYIALSYVWGKDVLSCRLNSANQEQYEKNIDVSAIPQKISDAIHFTRNMGVRYLWVDALCVAQDNATELSEELNRFPQYYANASMVICSLQPSSFSLRLRWEPDHKIDIPPYSILRPGILRSEPAEALWNKALIMQDECFRATPIDGNLLNSMPEIAKAMSGTSLPVPTVKLNHSAIAEYAAFDKTLIIPRRTRPLKSNNNTQANLCDKLGEALADQENSPPPLLNKKIEDQMLLEDVLVAYTTIGIRSAARAMRWVCSTFSACLNDLMLQGEKNPWSVFLIAGILVAALSFYAGSCFHSKSLI